MAGSVTAVRADGGRSPRLGAPPEQGPGRQLWGGTWRTMVAVVLGLLAVVGVAWQEELGERAATSDAMTALDMLVGLLGLGFLHLRRHAPLTTALFLAAFVSVSNFAIGSASIAVVSLATTRRWVSIGIVGAVYVGAHVTYLFVNPYVLDPVLNGAVDVGAGTMAYGLLVAIGAYIGLRRDHVRALVLRAETAEREQTSRVAQARANERARIAREMHDVLAHRISMVAMHAGALAYRTDLPREEVTGTAETIRDAAHTAMKELREILGVLRDLPDGPAGQGGDTEETHRPQPTLAALDELFEECRDAGMRVTHHDDREPGPELSESTSRTAYRIVQEGLTNARKHAAGQPVVVTVAGAPADGLAVTVANPLPPDEQATDAPSSGLGLMGLTERVEIGGGTLGYGVEGGRFVIRASLPWAT